MSETKEQFLERITQEEGKYPLSKEHICFANGHSMFRKFEFNNHQSQFGEFQCTRCGYTEEFQYDFPHGSNPNYKD